MNTETRLTETELRVIADTILGEVYKAHEEFHRERLLDYHAASGKSWEAAFHDYLSMRDKAIEHGHVHKEKDCPECDIYDRAFNNFLDKHQMLVDKIDRDDLMRAYNLSVKIRHDDEYFNMASKLVIDRLYSFRDPAALAEVH